MALAHLYEADYDQIHLLPPALEDWIPPDHPARFVRTFVEVALAAGDVKLDWVQGEGGAPGYAGALLLRVWLYGYYEGVRSCRGLEKALRDRLPFIWLAGMLVPDHNTLWRFFGRNKTVLKALFKRTLKVALEANCLGFVLHALDGTRIPAASATRSGQHREVLEARLGKLDEAIAALEQAIAAAGPGAGAADASASDALPQALSEARALRQAVQEAHDTLRLEGAEHLQPQEPEARIQKLADGRKLFGYNAQAVRDKDSQLIVAEDVVEDENDQDQLKPMLEQVQENLERTAALTATDKGYAKGQSMQAAMDAGWPAVVALPKPLAGRPDEPYHSARFTYEQATDTVTCPQGRTLPYVHDKEHKDKGYTVRVFRCPHEDCPVRAQCTRNKRGREIEVAPFHEALTAQRALNASEAGRAAIQARKHIIEPAFAQIKERFGFRRFTLRGLDGAKAQWTLVCTAHNLKKLYARWRAGQLPFSLPCPFPQPLAPEAGAA